jgi:thiosulfate/3-mercaptopyruvate sulfurtransferase
MGKWQECILAGGLLFSLLFIHPNSLYPSISPLRNFNHPRLIETGELMTFISHPSVRVVDMRTSLFDYLKAHLPNAIYLYPETLQVPKNGIPVQALDRICLERILGEYLGISNDMWVVLYSEKSNPNATYLAWALDFLGHKRVGIVNGGWEKWVFERLPITQDYPSLSPKRFFGKVVTESIAEKRWVRDHLTARDVVIVDARPLRMYSGEEGEEIRKGHIPGARSFFWETTLEGEEIKTWKNTGDLKRLFIESGVARGKKIIVYGQIGKEASHLYFTLKYILGFPNVHLYAGSWVEWSADRNLPIKVGMDP